MRSIFVTLFSIIIVSVSAQTQNNSIEILERFSNNFHPQVLEGNNIPVIGIVDTNWNSILRKAFQVDSLKTNQYLTLILLKLFESHLLCCNQAYTLPLRDPFVNCFLEINGFYKSESIKSIPKDLQGDMVWSSLAFDWLMGRVSFLNNNYMHLMKIQEINKQVGLIEQELQ